MRQNWFTKAQALGNDYIIVEPDRLSFPLTPETVQMLCDRHFGIGSDGVLAIVPSQHADFGLQIYNPDGSSAEKSGNGLRMAAKFLYDHKHTTKTQFTIETLGGLAPCTLHRVQGAVEEVEVDMGKATFQSEKIPALGEPREVIDEPMEAAGSVFGVTAVNVGNPHCVIFILLLTWREEPFGSKSKLTLACSCVDLPQRFVRAKCPQSL